MPINVGDAVLTFLGDTTQLDQAVAKVNVDTQAKVIPAALAVADLDKHWYDAGESAKVAGEEAAVAGEQFLQAGIEGEEAGEKMAFSMHEAKGELALLGEETGITIPRHIRGFVAELPGVGKALEAAFSATAVLFIVQLLAEGAEKLSEWVAETFIYTEAIKEEYKAQVDLNKAIAEQVSRYEGLKEQYKTIGVEGAAKTAISIEELTEKVRGNNDAIQENKDTIFLYNNYLQGTAEEAKKAKLALALLTKEELANEQQLANLVKLHAQQVTDESIARQNAVIEAEKTTQNAVIALKQAGTRVQLIQDKAAYSQFLAAQRQFDEDTYQIELNALNAKLANEKRDPTKNVTEIIRLHAQIEALEKDHQTNQLKQYGDFLLALQAARKNLIDQVQSSPLSDELIPNDAGKKIQDVEDAFSALGITGVLPLTHMLETQQKAYETLRSSGLATGRDLLRAQIELLATTIQLHKAQGEDTSADEARLRNMIKAYQDFTDVTNKLLVKQLQLFDMWHQKIPGVKKIFQDFGQLGIKTLDDLGAAAEYAAKSAILSQESFGTAMRKETAAILAEIAARSLVLAIYYTALGFARLAEQRYDLATQAFTAAAIYGAVGGAVAAAAYALNPKDDKGSGGSTIEGQALFSNDKPTATPQPAVPQPAQFTNVQKLAGGGLLTRPTMAMLAERAGNTKGEAAIPLDDPRAVSAIVEALGGGGATHNHFYIEGLISGDNLNQVVKNIDRNIQRGKTRLTSSNSFRVTKKA
jgi:hypothetical protein